MTYKEYKNSLPSNLKPYEERVRKEAEIRLRAEKRENREKKHRSSSIKLGDSFGILTAGFYKELRGDVYYRECYCLCGKTKMIAETNLLSGSTKSCGCRSFNREVFKEKEPLRNSYEIREDEIKIFCSPSPEYFVISKESEWILKNHLWTKSTGGIVSTLTSDKKKVSLKNFLLKEDKFIYHINGDTRDFRLSNLDYGYQFSQNKIIKMEKEKGTKRESGYYAKFLIRNGFKKFRK